MEITFNPRHWPHVPVWLWPLVWWQLYRLRRAADAQNVRVLFEITREGLVYVTHVSDHKDDLRAWLWAQQQVYRAHWIPMHDPSGEAHLCSIRYWTPRFMERGHLTNFISKRGGFPVAPAIDDSS